MRYLVEAAQAKKLDRITVGYTVAAWAVIQASSIGAGAFAWPQWIQQAVIVSGVTGLPVVLIGAWSLGVHRAAGGKLKPTRADLHVLALLSLFLVVAGVLFVWVFWPKAAAVPSAQQAAPPPNSVAVLPFANLSGDPAKQYFGEGIADELISELSRIPSLHVAARTSSFAFEGKHADVKTIARLLNVRSILDGSVRQSANHIRIEAELVDAANGFSSWSETYDRDLTDILALQDDIAGSVTRSMKATLLGTAFDARDRRGIDANAYRLYLEAKAAHRHGNLADVERAAELLRKVTALEPGYANGFAALGGALMSLVDRYGKTEFLAPAEAASRQAIRLDPKNLSALGALTALFLDKWQWKEALDTYRTAQAINPGSSAVLHLRSLVASLFNYPDEDISAEIKASKLDPLSPALKYNIALWYWNNKRYDQAAVAIQDVLRLRQGKFTDLDQQCAIEASRGNPAEAQRIAARISSYYASSPQNSLNCPFYIAIAEHNLRLARKIADAAAVDALANGGTFTTIGDCYRQLGDLNDAMKWYERAYDVRDVLLLGVPYEKWQTPALLGDPRWKALWARRPIRQWEAARLEAAKILGIAG
ncbi:MAG TPA: hypothetical protein VGI20_12975 [Rhizomicrobium sp.]|jgi:TolB-like protein